MMANLAGKLVAHIHIWRMVRIEIKYSRNIGLYVYDKDSLFIYLLTIHRKHWYFALLAGWARQADGGYPVTHEGARNRVTT